jgi:tetratricopeptide (TPR) repeat protein
MGVSTVADLIQVLGTIAGIGGVSLGILLLVYRDFLRDFIQTKAFRTLSSTQATMLMGSTIILTFSIAIVGVFAGFVAGAGAISFIALVGVLLLFILAVLLITTRRGAQGSIRDELPVAPEKEVFFRVYRLIETNNLDEADRELARSLGVQRNSAEFWYWKSRVAFARQNIDVAFAYIDEALKRDARHMHSIALKIKLMLLSTKRGERARALELAEQSCGISDALDVWLKCLIAEGMFALGVRSNTELDAKCPFPAHVWFND